MQKRWKMLSTDANLALMSETLKISPITAQVLAQRGIRTKKTAFAYLHPSPEEIHDTLLLKDAAKALETIENAIVSGKKIVIFGDYDVDGVMGTVILHKALTRLTALISSAEISPATASSDSEASPPSAAKISYYIPHRIQEGYGLNITAIRRLAADGTNLIIAVDNGISAAAEVRLATELGMEIVIIDHHEPGDPLAAAAIVDPKQPDCTYPFKELCAAALAYKLMHALFNKLQHPFSEKDELLALAAIATICDITVLQDENRTIVKNGLTALNKNKLINPGLGSLITRRGYLDKPLNSTSVGFIIGPCINASGRLKSAALAVDLLLAEAPEERITLANELSQLNEARKDITAKCADEAMETLQSTELKKVLVITQPTAHESVTGIVAGRIRETTSRPTIVLTHGDGAMKGSGRSIEAYNLFAALWENRHLFVRFGGHAMAAGLTILPENIPLLDEALNSTCTLTDDDFIPEIEIDRELKPEEITLVLSEEITKLEPFGKGNIEPVFMTRGLFAENIRIIDDKNTLIFTFRTKHGTLKGITFGMNEYFAQLIEETGANPYDPMTIDAVYNIETNVYNGNVSVQIRIRDLRLCGRL